MGRTHRVRRITKNDIFAKLPIFDIHYWYIQTYDPTNTHNPNTINHGAVHKSAI